METKVVKFGGSSLADAEQIKKAAAIIKSDPARRFAVVSAPGKRSGADTKVTDMLYACYDAAVSGGDFMTTLSAIKERYADIIEGLGVEFDIDTEIAIIAEKLETDPQRDYMASRGEYLNAKIIAKYLGFAFFDTAELVRFTAAGKFDDAVTDTRLASALSAVEYAVLPGFYGATDDGKVVTFSRGGSDVTGSLVAKAVGADIYENWTDVSGMLFTDPRIVENPRTIEYVSYRELRELSYMGASVLHEDAVFPVRKAGIPINIRNTNRPEDAGTMIVAEVPKKVQKRTVTGIAGRKGFTSITVEKSMMNGEIGFGARFLNIFAQHGIPFEHCPTGIDTMSVIVSTAAFREKRNEILSEIRSVLQPEFISTEPGLAMIAVVGHGMASTKGTSAGIFSALAEAGINIRMLDQGSSEMNIIIGVDEYDFEEAIRSIYKKFN